MKTSTSGRPKSSSTQKPRQPRMLERLAVRTGLQPLTGANYITSVLTTLVIASASASVHAAPPSKELFGNNRNTPSAATFGQTKKIEQLKKERTTAHLEVVNIDLTAFAGDSVQIPISATEVRTYVKVRVENHGNDSFTWFGNLASGQGNAILVVHKGIVTGTVSDGARSFKIESVGEGKHAFREINTTAYPAEHPELAIDARSKRRPTTTSTTTTPPPTTTTPPPTTTTPPPPPPTTVNGKTLIDVMVVYPSTVAGAVADVTGLATLAVAETNQAYVNSGVNIQMNLVGVTQIPYSESGVDYNTMLSNLTAMPDVKTQRTNLGADVVIMLTTNQAYCGLAYLNGGANYAYGVVSYSCATGYYSFAHEIGHIQGANHDPANEPSNNPYAYGHGYQSTNSAPAWRTIMAYNCAGGCTRLQYFSNPNLTYNGLAMGTPTVSDNARVLNQTAASVSAFRAHVGP
jgi:hypothetical protein